MGGSQGIKLIEGLLFKGMVKVGRCCVEFASLAPLKEAETRSDSISTALVVFVANASHWIYRDPATVQQLKARLELCLAHELQSPATAEVATRLRMSHVPIADEKLGTATSDSSLAVGLRWGKL